jgi:hypothetical protein
MTEKICKIHGATNFFPRADGGSRCGQCSADAVKNRRRKIKLLAIEYKGGACENCGNSFHPAVFEFHHKDPSQKDFAVGAGGNARAWELVKTELDKCSMLCANCHRIEHSKLFDVDPR